MIETKSQTRLRSKYKAKPPIKPIKKLEKFLNLDFNSVRRDELTKQSHPLFDWFICEQSWEKPEKLQRELIGYIDPLITSEAIKDVSQWEQLITLVKKINSLDLKWRWAIASGENEFEIGDGNTTANPARRFLATGQKLLEIQGKKWIVMKSSIDFNSLEEILYATVIKVLESGDLKWLKRCKECDKFFVPKDLRRKFCSSRHTKKYYDEGAPDRVKKSRAYQKKREERKRKREYGG